MNNTIGLPPFLPQSPHTTSPKSGSDLGTPCSISVHQPFSQASKIPMSPKYGISKSISAQARVCAWAARSHRSARSTFRNARAQTHTHTHTHMRAQTSLEIIERGAFLRVLLSFPEINSGSSRYLSLPVSLPLCNSGKLVWWLLSS